MNYLNDSSVVVRYFRLARHAFHSALRILAIGVGDYVLVPSFVCRELLASIHAVGAIEIYYDLGEDLRPITLPVDKHIRAVLAINYFGFPQDMHPFRKYCEANNAILIEDNAHGFLSRDMSGVELGTRGDLALFSIRKTFELPDGAMLVAIKSECKVLIESQLPFRTEALPLSFWVKSIMLWAQKSTPFKLASLGRDVTRFIRYVRTGYPIAPSLPECEFQLPMDPAPHRYSISALSRLDIGNEISRRRRLYTELHDKLSILDIVPVFGYLPIGTVPYGYPFYADSNTGKIVAKIVRKLGLDCARWPDLPDAVAQTALPRYHSLWLVNFKC